MRTNHMLLLVARAFLVLIAVTLFGCQFGNSSVANREAATFMTATEGDFGSQYSGTYLYSISADFGELTPSGLSELSWLQWRARDCWLSLPRSNGESYLIPLQSVVADTVVSAPKDLPTTGTASVRCFAEGSSVPSTVLMRIPFQCEPVPAAGPSQRKLTLSPALGTLAIEVDLPGWASAIVMVTGEMQALEGAGDTRIAQTIRFRAEYEFTPPIPRPADLPDRRSEKLEIRVPAGNYRVELEVESLFDEDHQLLSESLRHRAHATAVAGEVRRAGPFAYWGSDADVLPSSPDVPPRLLHYPESLDWRMTESRSSQQQYGSLAVVAPQSTTVLRASTAWTSLRTTLEFVRESESGVAQVAEAVGVWSTDPFRLSAPGFQLGSHVWFRDEAAPALRVPYEAPSANEQAPLSPETAWDNVDTRWPRITRLFKVPSFDADRAWGRYPDTLLALMGPVRATDVQAWRVYPGALKLEVQTLRPAMDDQFVIAVVALSDGTAVFLHRADFVPGAVNTVISLRAATPVAPTTIDFDWAAATAFRKFPRKTAVLQAVAVVPARVADDLADGWQSKEVGKLERVEWIIESDLSPEGEVTAPPVPEGTILRLLAVRCESHELAAKASGLDPEDGESAALARSSVLLTPLGHGVLRQGQLNRIALRLPNEAE